MAVAYCRLRSLRDESYLYLNQSIFQKNKQTNKRTHKRMGGRDPPLWRVEHEIDGDFEDLEEDEMLEAFLQTTAGGVAVEGLVRTRHLSKAELEWLKDEEKFTRKSTAGKLGSTWKLGEWKVPVSQTDTVETCAVHSNMCPLLVVGSDGSCSRRHLH